MPHIPNICCFAAASDILFDIWHSDFTPTATTLPVFVTSPAGAGMKTAALHCSQAGFFCSLRLGVCLYQRVEQWMCHWGCCWDEIPWSALSPSQQEPIAELTELLWHHRDRHNIALMCVQRNPILHNLYLQNSSCIIPPQMPSHISGPWNRWNRGAVCCSTL